MGLFKKFPSFTFIIDSAKNTFLRFPFTLLNAALGVTVAILLIEDRYQESEILQKLLLLAFLGLPLFTALTCYVEKMNWAGGKKYILHLIGSALLIGYYFTLRGNLFDFDVVPIRFFLLNIGLHFLVAFLPFLGKNQLNGFWQFNKSLFLRFLLSALFSGVLYIGLALALGALDYLFGVNIHDNYYFKLWVVCAGLVNTWIFLAGIPADLEKLNYTTEYPEGIKVFAQYILLPLVGLYFLILISYEFKIIVTMNLPKGWVSQMVLWYAVVGILSMLLLYPLRNKTENKWILIFTKWFFRILIPLVGMLWFAIVVRISNYGITENRYFVLAMALGLSIVVVYFIISKIKDIRIIPIVLCILAFLSAYGPWSAFSLSLNSQKARLITFFEKNNLLEDGVLVKAADPIPFEDRREISSIISYLSTHYGKELFKEWLDTSSYASIDTISRYSLAVKITEKIGFKYINEWEIRQNNQFFNVSLNGMNTYRINGYDFMCQFSLHAQSLPEKFPATQFIDYFQIELTLDSASTIHLHVNENNESIKKLDSSSFSIKEKVRELIEIKNKRDIFVHDMYLDIPTDSITAKLILTHVSGTNIENEITVQTLNGYLLLKLKE